MSEVDAANIRHHLRCYRLLAQGTLATPLWDYRSYGGRASISVWQPFDIEAEGVEGPDDAQWNRWYYKVARTLAIPRQCRFDGGIAAVMQLPHSLFDCQIEFMFEEVRIAGPEQGIINLVGYGGLTPRVVREDGTLTFPNLERDLRAISDPEVHTQVGGYTRAVAEARHPTAETAARRLIGL